MACLHRGDRRPATGLKKRDRQRLRTHRRRLKRSFSTTPAAPTCYIGAAGATIPSMLWKGRSMAQTIVDFRVHGEAKANEIQEPRTHVGDIEHVVNSAAVPISIEL